MKSRATLFVSGALIAATFVASIGLSAAPTLAFSTTHAPKDAPHIEPNAGAWQTWVLKSGSELRLPAPPDRAATRKEIAELKALAAKRDAPTLDRIAFWNTGAPVYRWNDILISETLERNASTLIGGRNMATFHAAVYDATVAAWDSKYAFNRPRPSKFDPSLKTAIPNPDSPAYPSEHAVTAGAASAVLAYLFPDEAQRFNDMANEAAQAFVQAGVQYPSDSKAGLELGRKVAEAIIARAKADGSDAPWTGSVPTEPGKWTGEKPALPTLGTWKTWVLTSGDALRPPPPPAYGSPEMQAELQAVQAYTRTPKSNALAMFWEYGAGGLRNFAFWNDQVSKKLFEHGLMHNAPHAARAYALTSIAYYDAGVACWDAKYTYWAMRPFQADPNFKPLFTTPNHPSYPSAHSCLSSGAAGVLTHLFPRDAATFKALVAESGDSRIWGGIHFPIDVKVGQELGSAVAQKVIEHAEGDGSH